MKLSDLTVWNGEPMELQQTVINGYIVAEKFKQGYVICSTYTV